MRIALLLLAAAGAQGQGIDVWNVFRGPNGSGVSNDTGFPTSFGKDKNMLWRSPVRPGKSSPVLTRDRIFVTAHQEKRFHVQCFDRKTGKLLWDRSIPRERKEISNRLNHLASPSPVTDGENVYAFFKDYGLISYDGAGKLRWKTPLGPFANAQGVAASPILAGDSIILVADQWENSYIASFSKSTGEMKWKTAREETEAWGTPLLYRPKGGGTQVVTTSRGSFGVHDAQDGKRVSTISGLGIAIVASPVLADDTVYVFGYGVETPQPFGPRLQKLDGNKDKVLSPDEYGDDPILNSVGKHAGDRDGSVTESEWMIFAKRVLGPNALVAVRMEKEGPRIVWRYDKNFTSVIPTPLAYQGVIYVMRNGGILTTHNASNSEVIKAARVEGALGGYSSSPVAAEGKVWVASEEGKVAVVKAAGEWETIAVNDLDEAIYATPALSKGVIYLRTDEALYAFGSK